MDYSTLQIANASSMGVYTLFAGVLAWQNRKMRGLRFIWLGLLVALVKVILQISPPGIPGSPMLTSEFYLLSFVLQMLGMRWFVNRSPLQHRWPLMIVIALMAAYTVLYSKQIPYIALMLNIPAVIICGVTAWMLLHRGKELFRTAARWGALFLLGEMFVVGYRAILTHVIYPTPWKYQVSRQDPRTLYSILAMMFLSACVAMCDLWFVITELQSELIRQAEIDMLTGVLNRRALLAAAAKEVSRSRRSGYVVCVLLLDIDYFKAINDERGHAAGDAALQFLALHLKSLLRQQDTLARTGGEEFTILLPETTKQRGRIAAERLRSSIETSPYAYNGTNNRMTLSIGVAELEPESPDFEEVWYRADMAMYAAKRLGRNRVYVDGSEVTEALKAIG